MMGKFRNFIHNYKTFFVFSFLILSFSFFLINFFALDSDYFWHIRAGEEMIHSHSVLNYDVFSWYLHGKYWMSHEWLFEVFLYGLRCLFPLFHTAIYAFLCVFSCCFLLFFSNRRKYLKNIPFTLLWIFLFLCFCGYIQCRPHLLSLNFLVLTIWFLYDLYHDEDSKKIYFLPLITILWANFHGGSSNLSYILCLLFLLSGMFSFSFSKIYARRISKKQAFKYVLVMILCIGCICLNPHGIKMLWYPYLNLSNTLMLSNISEWQPTVLSEPSHYIYFCLLFIIIIVVLFSKKKIRFLDLLLFGAVCFLGLKSIRFWPYTYVAATYFIFDYVGKRKYEPHTHILCVILGCAMIFVTFMNYHTICSHLRYQPINDKMIQAIQKENPKKLYNNYDYGGYLIYRNILVFIDGRADLYSDYNYQDYISICYLQDDYESLLKKYSFDYFLVNRRYPIATYLRYHDDYEEFYHFRDVVLYKRKNSA